jgi:hypothetical protein
MNLRIEVGIERMESKQDMVETYRGEGSTKRKEARRGERQEVI